MVAHALEPTSMITGLDHVVVGVPDLAEGIAWWEAESGIRPAVGGPHDGLGTCNAVASLGVDSYLEIVSVDPAQSAVSQPREWLARLDGPRPFGWCWRCDDAAKTRERLEAAGIEAPRMPLERVRPDGVALAWECLFPIHELGRAIPFLIDWGDTPSPAADAPDGCTLLEATPLHPERREAQAMLDRMGISAEVDEARESGLRLRFGSPRGTIVVET